MVNHSDNPAIGKPATTILVEPGDIFPLDVGHRGLERSRDGSVDVRNRDRATFTKMFEMLDADYNALDALRAKDNHYIAQAMTAYHHTLAPPRSGQNRYDPEVIYHPKGTGITDKTTEIWNWFKDYIDHKMFLHKTAIHPLEASGELLAGTPKAIDALKHMAIDIPQRFNEISLLRMTVRKLRSHEADPQKQADYDTMLEHIGNTRAHVAALWEMSTYYIAINGAPEQLSGIPKPIKLQVPLSDPEIKQMMHSQFNFIDDMLTRLTRLIEHEPILPLLNEVRAQKRLEKGITTGDKVGYVPEPLTGWGGLRNYVKKLLVLEMAIDRKSQTPADISKMIVRNIRGEPITASTAANGASTTDASAITDTTASNGKTATYSFADYQTFNAKSHELYDLLQSFEEKPGVNSQTIEACKTARKELRMMNRAIQTIEKFCDMTIDRAASTDLPAH